MKMSRHQEIENRNKLYSLSLRQIKCHCYAYLFALVFLLLYFKKWKKIFMSFPSFSQSIISLKTVCFSIVNSSTVFSGSILFMCCLLQLVYILLRILVFMLIRDVDFQFSCDGFVWYWYGVMLASQDYLSSVLSSIF